MVKKNSHFMYGHLLLNHVSIEIKTNDLMVSPTTNKSLSFNVGGRDAYDVGGLMC